MADAKIRAVITAEDRASAVVKNFASGVDHAQARTQTFAQKAEASFARFAATAVAAGFAVNRLVGTITSSVQAANRSQAAMIGLSSVTRAFGQDTAAATAAAQDLATDGLMTVGEAAQGLKNLIAAGFNLPQAITLMKRFRDSAAFGRQGALDFGQAIVSATEGVKNGNSILVDNAGVTKNLSVILEEAGYSAQDLMRATTDAGVRMAIFNGILRETNPQVGDAARLAETFAGQQAKASTQVLILKQQVGEALQPALLKLLETVTPLIVKFAEFTNQHPQLVSNVLLGTTVLLGIAAAVGVVGTSLHILIPVVTGAAGAIRGLWAASAGLYATLGAGPFILAVAGVAAVWAAYSAVKALEAAYKGMISAENLAQDTFERNVRRIHSLPISAEEKRKRIQLLGQTLDGRAEGGPVAGGMPYVVGERGPELFVPNRSGTIVPNNQLASAKTTINLNVNVGTFVGTEMEKRKLAEEIMRAWDDLQSARGLSAAQAVRL